MDYRSAGVDIDKGDRIVDRIKEMMGNSGARIGHFGGAIPFPVDRYQKPLLISSIDSVGTKVMIAKEVCRHDSVGMDLVHHCINDIACCGAEPIAFLDYVAMGIMDEYIATAAVSGIIKACQRWDVLLVGGETAEMPGVYKAGEYDLVGVINGVVEESEFIDGKSISAGDVLIGFPSTGLHTNGYSLARKVFESAVCDTYMSELNQTVSEALLAVHRCYLGEIRHLKSLGRIKGLAHITGGGLSGNIARIIPKGLRMDLFWGDWSEPPIFSLIRQMGNIPEEDMRRTFNLGIGMVAVLDPETARKVLSDFPEELADPLVIGHIV
ncbi:MAG: phosphoribosylformylglycinamidine cyclo-ligase [Candidatus Electryoneaceae bacterium]|nr:phosphoribosylformylglycinamidine cyclo-ligase [Candidatus Electryoneaceae bacterium]